jgi:hypothetical protein
MGAETDDDAVGGDAPPRTKAADSWRDVVSPSLAFAGTQACWAVQVRIGALSLLAFRSLARAVQSTDRPLASQQQIGHTSAELRKLGLRDELVRFSVRATTIGC